MTAPALDRLAARLRRPPRALSGLARLSDEELCLLEATIDAACARQRIQAEQALRRLLPPPLRRLLLGPADRRNP